MKSNLQFLYHLPLESSLACVWSFPGYEFFHELLSQPEKNLGMASLQ